MKKRVLAVVMCALMAGTAFTGFKDAGDDKELVLFTWEGMFPQEVLDDFEKETGVKVGQNTQKFSFGELIKELAHNRSLIGIIVCALVFLLAQLSLSNMNAYIYPNYFGNIKALDERAALYIS